MSFCWPSWLPGARTPRPPRRLDADIESVNERISQAQEERKAYGKGSVVHDLISMRIAIHQQTLAMLEQRRAAEQWRTTLTYTVDGKSYSAPADHIARVAALQAQAQERPRGPRVRPAIDEGIRRLGQAALRHEHRHQDDPDFPARIPVGRLRQRLPALLRSVPSARQAPPRSRRRSRLLRGRRPSFS